MSCGACARGYGFFCKETGCPNCGFSFCTKCLKKEIEVPRCGGSKLKVCLRCFEKLEKAKSTQNNTLQVKASDVLALDEPIDSLAKPIEPIQVGVDALALGEDIDDDDDKEEDNEIADNLDSIISKKLSKLKNDGTAISLPHDSEMAARLSALKGIPHKEYSNKYLLETDKRSEQEKIYSLLKQFVEEKGIEEVPANDPIADIERRLALLKGQPVQYSAGETSKGVIMPDATEEDEDVAIKKVLDKLLEEAKLPDSVLSDELGMSLPKPNKDTEELPWCTICNEDATTRCLGCDGDLFCTSCFRECHDDDDFREHKSEVYKKPPTPET